MDVMSLTVVHTFCLILRVLQGLPAEQGRELVPLGHRAVHRREVQHPYARHLRRHPVPQGHVGGWMQSIDQGPARAVEQMPAARQARPTGRA